MAGGCKCYQSKGAYIPHPDPSNQMNYILGNVCLWKECAHRCLLWFLLSRGLLLPSEANLGHVVSCACCTTQAPDLHMAVTKVFIHMSVLRFRIAPTHVQQWRIKSLLDGFIRRTNPRNSSSKTRRISYDPVLELYYYKSKRVLIRAMSTQNIPLQESMGHGGESITHES